MTVTGRAAGRPVNADWHSIHSLLLLLSQPITNDHQQRTLGAAEEGSNRLVSPFVVFIFARIES